MCVTSAVIDNWGPTLPQRHPGWFPDVQPTFPPAPTTITIPSPFGIGGVSGPPTREEFDALRKEMIELKELIKAANKFDVATGQKDCEMQYKVDFVKKVAEAVGVDLSDVFGK